MDQFYNDTSNDYERSYGEPPIDSEDWSTRDELFGETDDYDQETHSLDNINERDYSLNSPLISDELIEFAKFSRQEDHRSDWSNKAWEESLSYFKSKGIERIESEEVNCFHNYWGKLNLTSTTQHGLSDMVLTESSDSANSTSDVPLTFINTVFKQQKTEVPTANSVTEYMKRLFNYFVLFHWITCLMNSKTNNERKNILGVLYKGGVSIVSNDLHGDTINVPQIGEFMITRNFIYHFTRKRLLSLTHVLMMKDTMIGRFNSLLYLHWKIDPLLSNFSVEGLERWYQQGDELLVQLNNKFYDVLGMIEPCCNLRFVETSSKKRPKIPLDNAFRNHVLGKINEYSILSPQVRPFFDYILEDQDVHSLCVKYGSFRHWGHPEIEYLEGLDKLHTQVQMEKDIDENYAEALASDLAYLVLTKKFQETHTWYIDLETLDKNDILYPHVINKTFPSDADILKIGDNWHKYPLLKCFDIPDVIEPSDIYSDKSHSPTYSEVLNHVTSRKPGKIPSKRVLSTYLNTTHTNWKEFLKRIDTVGLTREMLIIGLKAKEREIKRVGRFFALMSWELREYFVVTEFLIKKHFVPLFSGLTMADDLATVTKKMLDRVTGQGMNNYSQICYANHIDYNKWNNHQRLKSTGPTFKVMGQFLGYPNLIYRTHEFFEQAFVYYNNRPDLMELQPDGTIGSKPGYKVCWNGQLGGLEGLRQKGWSILNLLVIRREAKLRNTKVSVLAQGDNQVVCTHYSTQGYKTDSDLQRNLINIYRNNNFIMKKIKEGTEKLGLIINQDETIQASDYLNYGKVPIWRGNICALPTKRWARVCCVTNDQLPTMANLMSSVSTSALTVSNFSPSPIPSILALNFFGNLVRSLCDLHNPATRCSVFIPDKSMLMYKLAFLYLDPSLGGISGTSLTRFLIRGFPDPVTESLSFWKLLASHSTSETYKMLYRKLLNVKVNYYTKDSFPKLLENPTSLNIHHGINPETLIKEHIKEKLLQDGSKLQNEIVREMLRNHKDEEIQLNEFLEGIHPRFPRFNSEFKAATFIGISNSLIGLFQNAKTIKSMFKSRFVKDINKIIKESEENSIKMMINLIFRYELLIGELCTAQLADELRSKSWGDSIVGCTVPHPVEMFFKHFDATSVCEGCDCEGKTTHITTRVKLNGFEYLFEESGPYPPYLGSTTSESTSLLTPWEQTSNVPIIRKAVNLRKAIGWLTESDSKLGLSILQILHSLTGIQWKSISKSFKRTGSAIHRFGSERQSAGGYNAISPTLLSRIYSTTDHLLGLQDKNYDFMFQSTILYSQLVSGISYINDGESVIHGHISCRGCVREIQDIKLESYGTLNPPDKSYILNLWKPHETPWLSEHAVMEDLHNIDWHKYDLMEKSFAIGRIQGFLFGLLHIKSDARFNKQSIFPQVLSHKVNIIGNLSGILNGIALAGGLHSLHRSFLYNKRSPHRVFVGSSFTILRTIGKTPEFLSYVNGGDWDRVFLSINHSTPPSYPTSDSDRASYVTNYLTSSFLSSYVDRRERLRFKPLVKKLIIFSDVLSVEFSVPLIISNIVLPSMFLDSISEDKLKEFREYTDILSKLYKRESDDQWTPSFHDKTYLVPEEIRHALCESRADVDSLSESRRILKWGKELTAPVIKIPVIMGQHKTSASPYPILERKSPLMSSLRVFRFATTSHYKIRSLLIDLSIKPRDFMVLADGSGGITSLCLRLFPTSRGIFNSLIDLRETTCTGQDIGMPSTVLEMGSMAARCLNLSEVSQKPSDLRFHKTWSYLKSWRNISHCLFDLVIIDLETDLQSREDIESKMDYHISDILERGGTVIYKTLLDVPYLENTLSIFGKHFTTVDICQSDISSSFSNEIFIIGSGSFRKPRILYPDMPRLIEGLLNLHCYQLSRVEFDRVLRYNRMDMLAGVPPLLLTTKETSLMLTLQRFGIPSTVAIGLYDNLRLDIIPDLTKMYALFLIGGHSIFYHSAYNATQLVPPSDSIVRKLISWTFGFSYWIAEQTKDFDLFKYLNQYYVKRVGFYWDNFQEQNGKYVIRWNFRERHSTFKALYPDKDSAEIINLLRCLHYLTHGCTILPTQKDIKGLIRSYLLHININSIPMNTGFFDLLSKVQLPEPENDEIIDTTDIPDRITQYDCP